MPLDGIPVYWFTLALLTNRSLEEVSEMTVLEAYAWLQYDKLYGHPISHDTNILLGDDIASTYNVHRTKQEDPILGAKDFYWKLNANKEVQVKETPEEVTNRIRRQLRF